MHPDTIGKGALAWPAFTRLKGKRVVLASASPRRVEILASADIHPEVVPSTFNEDLTKDDFVGEMVYEYPVETASRKALDVYKRLVATDTADPPDLVIGADTVVLHGEEILEKPLDPTDNLRMLADLNGTKCTVMTAVALVHPILHSPGYQIRTLCERTGVYFADLSGELLRDYVQCGEGSGRAGGFAIQGRGALLIRGIEGDYNNVVGFPLFSFVHLVEQLVEDEELDFEGGP
ncbi:hypothetical protein MSPP1_000760 [Malassezia sp. CBS 17886]|nr:hypothetical protein MSPP1_000760 [Malassezia sp. CBS 17886]